MRATFFRKPVMIEFLTITFLGVLYISLFMPLASTTSFTGVEHERLTGVLLPAEIGLREVGRIPAWNPYIGTGEPFLNNPFNYLYNPFASLPILLFGGVVGSKIAIGLGILIAGYSAWLLARTMGMGAVARVSVGALYMMSGGIAGKFFPGHLQLGLSLGWMPLVFAGLWWTLHSHDRRAPLLLAVAFALLFFAGNIFYTLHTLICCMVIAAFFLIERRPRWRRRMDRLRRLMIGAAFGLGLTMVLFLPVWAIRDSIKHGLDTTLESHYGIEQIIHNFTVNGDDWLLGTGDDWLIAVDYAYIGTRVFGLVGLAIVVIIISRKARREFPYRTGVIALVCAALMMIWGAGQAGFIQYLYANVPLLAQFRFVGRALSVAALWWIVLGGLAINVLWKEASDMLKTPPVFSRFDYWRLARAAILGTAVWLIYLAVDYGKTLSLPRDTTLALDAYRAGMTYRPDVLPRLGVFLLVALALDTLRLMIIFPLWGRARSQVVGLNWRAIGTRLLRIGVVALACAAITDLLLVNSQVFKTGTRVADYDTMYAYIHAHDDAPIPAVLEPNTETTAFEAYYHGTRQWGLNEGWIPAALPNEAVPDLFDDEPRWTLVLERITPTITGKQFLFQQCLNAWTKQAPDEPCQYLAQITAGLYELPDALPYAFIAPENVLTSAPETLNGSNVVKPTNIQHELDTITLVAHAPESETPYFLVVQETNFPGWGAWVDGMPTKNVSMGQFIGIPMLTGIHTYTLRYQPPGFTTGLVISLLTACAIGLYLRPSRRAD